MKKNLNESGLVYATKLKVELINKQKSNYYGDKE